MPSSPPPMTHFSMVIPYPGAPGAPKFDGRNITHFLDLYDQLCSDYRLSESEKINRLPSYCEFFTGNYVKILIKGADWAAVRAILRREYKENDIDQLMYSREFLEALKKKARSEDDNLIHYCHLFASISKDLVLRKRLDRYTQCQWFLQGLPERIVMEIFYQYDIDLEDDNSLDFEDVLEKALVLVKRRKFLVDFIQDKMTDPVNKYAEPPEKVFYPPKVIESFADPVQDCVLPNPSQTMQGPIQEDIPVVRIHTLRAEEVKASEVSSAGNVEVGVSGVVEPFPEDLLDDWSLISDPAEDLYEGLDALFTNFELKDEEVGQLHVISVTVVELFDNTSIGPRKYAHRPDSSKKRISSKFLNLLDAGVGVRKKAGMISEEGPAGFDGIVVGRGLIKSEDHG